LSGQLLVVAAQPRHVAAEQCPIDRKSASAAVSLHRHLCAARHAAVRRQVQLRRPARQAAQQLRLVLAVAAHRLSGAAADSPKTVCAIETKLTKAKLK